MAVRGKIALFVVALSLAAVGAECASASTAKLNMTSIVSGTTLDGDWGSDEVYGDARLYDRLTGKLAETVQTNRLYGSW
jgi:hypothetical protein